MTAVFEIATVVNDAAQYEAMLASFRAAGFVEPRVRYRCYDNTASNCHDPFEILRGLPRSGEEPYLILCHQDVRPDLGHGYADLRDRLERLTEIDHAWRVAGNAGGDPSGRSILHLNDPNSDWRTTGLPMRVQSLDENFLVLRRTTEPAASKDLYGFHFYGTDVCLTAISRGHYAYVIDFLLTHLSGGNTSSPAFINAKEAFERVWGRRVVWACIHTPCTDLAIARTRLLRNLCRRPLVCRFLRGLGNPVITRRM